MDAFLLGHAVLVFKNVLIEYKTCYNLGVQYTLRMCRKSHLTPKSYWNSLTIVIVLLFSFIEQHIIGNKNSPSGQRFFKFPTKMYDTEFKSLMLFSVKRRTA